MLARPGLRLCPIGDKSLHQLPRNLLKTRTGYPMGVCALTTTPKGWPVLSTLSTSAPAPCSRVYPTVSRRGTCDRVLRFVANRPEVFTPAVGCDLAYPPGKTVVHSPSLHRLVPFFFG